MDTNGSFIWSSPWTLLRADESRTKRKGRSDTQEPQVRQGNRIAKVAGVIKEDGGIVLVISDESGHVERWAIAEHSLADKIEYELASQRMRR